MVRAIDCFKKYGTPKECEESHMIMWDVPQILEIGVIPKKIYCNKDIITPLKDSFTRLINRNLISELKTWDGCFNLRVVRGYERAYDQFMAIGDTESADKLLSIHSWGIAIDINAAWNQLGKEPSLSPDFVKCFTESGFEWGGEWKRKDGMHFQLAKI